ncbi:DUF3888 domain-containing protein [Bacillus sp. MRMR6]|uniref:DUF3888 domain-containing protein n=1 Tax=Bacillus sp. MRMR6 TaxID=1928617 RepID=UPI0009522A79|nr:DUF3888 domain-containing protein [Bacillus sp. MRMR6]OLS33447.1 hypothetical protein BTR25_25860 [Bacillus sp. MRMR6]
MKLNIVIIIILCLMVPVTVHASDQQIRNLHKEFDIDLTGYTYDSLATLNQLGNKITPLMQLYLWVIQLEQEWVDEPRLYTKGNRGYVHLWKKDGTNVLYQVHKRPDGMWEITDIERKKIDRIPVPKTLLKDVLIERLIDPIGKAVEEYYQPKLWYRGDEKILKIKKEESDNAYYVTVQVQTFVGPHNPPYGEETITFRIRGSEINVSEYKHRDIPEEEWTKLKLR